MDRVERTGILNPQCEQVIPRTNLKMTSFPFFQNFPALAMVYTGARTVSTLQMGHTMNFSSGADFHSGFKYMPDRLNDGAEGMIRLNDANSLWHKKILIS